MEINNIIKKVWSVMAAAACAGVIGSITGLIFIKPVYSASARYYVYETAGEGTATAKEASEYVCLFSSGDFLNDVSQRAGLKYPEKKLKKMVKVQAVKKTSFLEIKIRSQKPSEVFQLHKVIERVKDRYISDITGGTLSVKIVETASFPKKSHRPGYGAVIFLFAVSGGTAAFFVTAKHHKKNIQSAKDISQKFIFPVIAEIPSYGFVTENNAGKKSPDFTAAFRKMNSGFKFNQDISTDNAGYNPDRNTIMINKNSAVDFSLAFKSFFSDIHQYSDTSKNIITISSAMPGEGKTTIAINLGITMASEGKQVLLIDGNMRNGRLMKAFGLNGSLAGLSDIIFGKVSAKEAILLTEYRSLFVLPNGTFNGNPLSLLTHSDTLAVIASLKEMFDYIIIDTPPVNVFSDVLTLTGISDLIFLTVRNKVTTEDDIEKAVKSFELSDVKISGFVLNDTET